MTNAVAGEIASVDLTLVHTGVVFGDGRPRGPPAVCVRTSAHCVARMPFGESLSIIQLRVSGAIDFAAANARYCRDDT